MEIFDTTVYFTMLCLYMCINGLWSELKFIIIIIL